MNHMIETYVTIGQQCYDCVALTTVLNENSSNSGNVAVTISESKKN